VTAPGAAPEPLDALVERLRANAAAFGSPVVRAALGPTDDAIADLNATVAALLALRAERDMNLRDLQALAREHAVTESALAAALRRAEEGERDTARLDKAERVLAAAGDIGGWWHDNPVAIFDGSGSDLACGSTLRAALDAYAEPARTEGGKE